MGSSVVLGALKGVGVAFRFVGTSALWMGRAVFLNPIGLAIATIAGGALLLQQNWSLIKPFWSNLWNSITAKTKKVWGQIKGAFSISNISKHFNIIVNKIKAPFVGFFDWIGKKFAWVSSLMGSAKITQPKVVLSLEKNRNVFADRKTLNPTNNVISHRPIIKTKPKTLRDSILGLKKKSELSLRTLPITSVSAITQDSIAKVNNVTNNKNVKTTQTFNTTFNINNEGGNINEHELERAWKKVQRKITKEENDRQIADMTA
jgi:hypothetical protein